jgi:beta-galactosidase/beta-glucuronidase
VTGIWQTVWLEPVARTYIDTIKIIPDVDNQTVTVVVEVKGEPEDLSYSAEARAPGFSASAASAINKLMLDITDQKLWSPDSPFLYDLKVQIKKGDTVIDDVGSYCGMRKISLARDDRGIMRIMLNNQFLFQYGPLDQGWWPDGLYTAPSDEALKSDVAVLKTIGMNMLRKHGKVEPARLYYWCDTLGILVWQDMPGGDYNKVFRRRTAESAAWFEKEWKCIIKAFYNHPSIVMWIPFNEGWGQFDTARIATMTEDADPTRLVNNASGWTDKGAGDVHDIHAYPGPEMPDVEEQRAVVLGEFGGLGLPVAGHTWQEEKNWGYRSCKNSQELMAAYEELLNRLRPLVAKGLSAAVYTQITDVESEVNGLMTYDRKVIKMDADRLKSSHKSLYQ